MKITSPVFEHNTSIPPRYTCSGEDINPELHISGVPSEAKSLALIMEDPDSPSGTWTHWTLWNIDPHTKVIGDDHMPEGAVEGETSFKKTGYGGPCPQEGIHHYSFKLYALDATLSLPSGSEAGALKAMIDEHIVEEAELIGTYERKQ